MFTLRPKLNDEGYRRLARAKEVLSSRAKDVDAPPEDCVEISDRDTATEIYNAYSEREIWVLLISSPDRCPPAYVGRRTLELVRVKRILRPFAKKFLRRFDIGWLAKEKRGDVGLHFVVGQLACWVIHSAYHLEPEDAFHLRFLNLLEHSYLPLGWTVDDASDFPQAYERGEFIVMKMPRA